jgi:hypothetical protein
MECGNDAERSGTQNTADTPLSLTFCGNLLNFKFRRYAMASLEIFLANGFKTRDSSVGIATR